MRLVRLALLSFSVLLSSILIDGHEGGGKRAFREQVAEQVRKAVGEQEAVGDSRRSQRDGKQDVSDKAKQAADCRPRGEDRGGAERRHASKTSTKTGTNTDTKTGMLSSPHLLPSPPMSSPRPTLLNPLFAPLSTLKGVGPQRLPALEKLCAENRILNLLAHAPRKHRPRYKIQSISELPTTHETPPHIAIVLSIARHIPPATPRLPYRILCADNSNNTIELLWFKAQSSTMQARMPEGAKRTVCGSLSEYQGKAQLAHPEQILPEQAFPNIPENEPQWRLTHGITRYTLKKLLAQALERVPNLPEWHPEQFLQANAYPSFRQAIFDLHTAEQEKSRRAHARLAYDELFAHHLALALVKRHWGHKNKRKNKEQEKEDKLSTATQRLEAFHQNLPFQPTAAQQRAVLEIRNDIEAEASMLRLLQGDVGSGKTYVAACALLCATAEAGQGVLMAPSDLLARQHVATLQEWFAPLGIEVALLCGSLAKKEREKTLERIESGAVSVVVGTHALFQKGVLYRDLRLAVIDEQHRFGVYQRAALLSKSSSPDVLVMSATPIPRTLMLSVWGGIALSRLDEKPAGRQPIETRTVSLGRIEEVLSAVARWRSAGDKIYWVCPTITESEPDSGLESGLENGSSVARVVTKVVSVEERVRILRSRFSSSSVVFLHSKLSSDKRAESLQRFVSGDADILVATTMIEVGIDIPSARAIVIENAEHFGLAQLHQLRGRVGRDGGAARCLLLFDGAAGEEARSRLSILRETQDGFRIAEEDWRLRGSGDLLGVRQSGLPQFLFVDFGEHYGLARAAAEQARVCVARDPWLRGEGDLRLLLALFEQGESLEMVEAA